MQVRSILGTSLVGLNVLIEISEHGTKAKLDITYTLVPAWPAASPRVLASAARSGPCSCVSGFISASPGLQATTRAGLKIKRTDRR
jgi:hypothetical protein